MLTDLVFRPEAPTPISHRTTSAAAPTTSKGQQTRPRPDRETPSLQVSSGDDDSESHRIITELVRPGTAAPAHFGTGRRHLLRPQSAPKLRLSSVSARPSLKAVSKADRISKPHLTSPSRHFPASTEQPLSFAVDRPGRGAALVKPTALTEGLVHPQQVDLPHNDLETPHSGGRVPTEARNHSRKQSPQHRSPSQRDVLSLAHSESAHSKERPRSPPFDLTPTDNELSLPSIPARSASRPSPYPPVIQETPTPLVRRKAVSYRNTPPPIFPGQRQRQKRITAAPVCPLQRTSPSSPKPNPLRLRRVWSFSKKEFSPSPVAAQATSANRSQDPHNPDSRHSGVSGQSIFTRTSSSSNTNEASFSSQEPDSSQTGSCETHRSRFISDLQVGPLRPGISKSAAPSASERSSSAALAVFDFGFDKEVVEKPPGSDPLASGTQPNTPAASHPFFADFKFSFPTVESSPEKDPEEGDSTEPSLPKLPLESTGRPPRGISSAIRQARQNLKPEYSSRPDHVAQSPSWVRDPTIPRLELPSFNRLSLGLFNTEIEEPALSEIAKGKRPEPRQLTSSPPIASEDMDFLNPESAMAMTGHRREAIRMAKSQEAAVVEKCRRSGAPAPGYTFDELIGKGSFGRVYKGSVYLES
jgi:hypothetical protein